MPVPIGNGYLMVARIRYNKLQGQEGKAGEEEVGAGEEDGVGEEVAGGEEEMFIFTITSSTRKGTISSGKKEHNFFYFSPLLRGFGFICTY